MFSVIKIDLDTYSNQEELTKTFTDLTKGNSLIDESGNIGSIENLVKSTWMAKIKHRLNKIWFDTNTWTAIAYESNKEQNFFDTFISFLKDSPCVSSGDIIKPKINGILDLSLDTILDKINDFGMYSLTNEEKEFLKNC